MDAQEKWQKARDILNNNPSEEQQNEAIALLKKRTRQIMLGQPIRLLKFIIMGHFLNGI